MGDGRSVLQYAKAPDYGSVPTWPLKAAAVAGAIPLCAGVAITALFHFSEWKPLIRAGFICLLGGPWLFGVGALLLLYYQYRANRGGFRRHRAYDWVLLLLLANFPAAFLCMAVSVPTMDLYHVVLVNTSAAAVTNITVQMGASPPPAVAKVVPVLGPGTQQTVTFTLPDHANFSGRATIGGVLTNFPIDSDVYQGNGPIRRIVTFPPTTTQPSVE